MASKYWIKLWIEILDDPKMGRLPDRLFRRAIECFLLAGDENQRGSLPSLEDMAWRLRANVEQLESDLLELQRFGIISQNNGEWFVSNFAKRQSKMDAAERMRRMRERKRKMEYKEKGPGHLAVDRPYAPSDTGLGHGSDAPVTDRNIDTDTESDTESDTDKDGGAKSAPLDEVDANIEEEKTPENDLFYAITKHIFGFTPKTIPKASRQRIGRAKEAIEEIDPDVQPPDVEAFALWWARSHDGAHRPLDPAKIQIHWAAFRDADPQTWKSFRTVPVQAEDGTTRWALEEVTDDASEGG